MVFAVSERFGAFAELLSQFVNDISQFKSESRRFKRALSSEVERFVCNEEARGALPLESIFLLGGT